MKKIFALTLLFLASAMGFSQQTFLKGSGVVTLFQSSDKVGLGTTSRLDSKLTIQSLAGETPIALRGILGQTYPFISIAGPTGSPFWSLYASTDWWVMGTSKDSTAAWLSVKPAKRWARMNLTLYLTKVISPAATLTAATITGATVTTGSVRNLSSDTTTIARFMKLTPTTAPANAIGRVYLSSADSCIYYYTGSAWKKLTAQ